MFFLALESSGQARETIYIDGINPDATSSHQRY